MKSDDAVVGTIQSRDIVFNCLIFTLQEVPGVWIWNLQGKDYHEQLLGLRYGDVVEFFHEEHPNKRYTIRNVKLLKAKDSLSIPVIFAPTQEGMNVTQTVVIGYILANLVGAGYSNLKVSYSQGEWGSRWRIHFDTGCELLSVVKWPEHKENEVDIDFEPVAELVTIGQTIPLQNRILAMNPIFVERNIQVNYCEYSTGHRVLLSILEKEEV